METTGRLISQLYDTDFIQWVDEQAKALDGVAKAASREERQYYLDALDWENLREEIESLGKSDLREANSFLKQLIIHRLKLDYSKEIYSRGHWEDEVEEFTEQLQDLMTNSLSNKINLEKIYQRARKQVLKHYRLDLPDTCPYSLDELLNR